jgi:hypothetical protein
VAFVAEGRTQKLEVVRELASTIVYWPRDEGRLLVATAPSVAIYDPALSQIATPAAAVQPNKSIQFSWTPEATRQLAEDYRYEVTFTAGGAVRKDVVYFDLVRVALACPVDQNQLEAIEPDLPKWLAARSIADASRWIVRAWDDVVGRIRAAGYRPALITDRSPLAATVALVKVLTSLIRQTDDVWDRKRDLHQEDYEAAWAAIGALKFEDGLTPGPALQRALSQPHWRR